MKHKISTKTRVAKAGVKMAEAVIEMIHLMYQNDTALRFLNSFIETMNKEFERRKNDTD